MKRISIPTIIAETAAHHPSMCVLLLFVVDQYEHRTNIFM